MTSIYAAIALPKVGVHLATIEQWRVCEYLVSNVGTTFPSGERLHESMLRQMDPELTEIEVGDAVTIRQTTNGRVQSVVLTREDILAVALKLQVMPADMISIFGVAPHPDVAGAAL